MTGALLATTAGHDRAAPRRIAATVAEVVAPQVVRSRADVESAVHEAIANAVLHGGPPIEVETVRGDGAVEVRIGDAGRNGRTPSRPAAERGRGRTIIAASCDQVRVEALASGGRRVRLRFTSHAAAGSPAVSPRCGP